MNKNRLVIIGIFVLFFAANCTPGRKAGTASQTDAAKPSGVRYLKNNIHVQLRYSRRGRPVYKASYANYTDPGEGHMVISYNTPVTWSFRSGLKGNYIMIVDKTDGKTIQFLYHAGRMRMTREEYMNLITSPVKISLEGLSRLDRQGIKEGRPYVGMSKEGIRIALGYPAAHKTPSLNSYRWTYWTNRFKSIMIEFDNSGRVINIWR